MQTAILVGDIGSTKSTWWYRTNVDHEIHLTGYNPLAHSIQHGNSLFEALSASVDGIAISAIWYYGTGVINERIEQEIGRQLSLLFPNSLVHVSSDLIGAAIAANGKIAGTVAILGTGSHAAVWDGSKIIRQTTSLGYILGDEGSGCDIGKAIIQAYFYKELPEIINKEMSTLLPTGRAGLFEQLNISNAPNQYLAGFAEIAVDFKDHPWVKELVSGRFKLFIKRHVIPLDREGPIHVIGSIGYIFADIFREALEQAGLSSGKFIQNPSRQLFESHVSNG